MRLRDYQRHAISALREAFREHRRVGFVLPTGGGKTVVFASIADLAHGRVLILQHRRELVEQAAAKLRAIGIQPGITAAGVRDPHPDARVRIAMVPTLARRRDALPAADFVIADECHLAAAPTWQRLFDHYSDAWLLGVTATWQRLDGKPIAPFTRLVRGPTVADLTRDGHLVPADVYSIPGADLSGLRRRAGEYRDAHTAMDRPALIGDAARHYRRLADGKRGIVYASSVEHAHRLAGAYGPGWHAITGNMPSHQRDHLIARFRNGDGVTGLTNYGVLIEGVDVPAVEYIGWMRPTASLTVWLQGCGRGLRPAPGKQRVIIADHAGNAIRHGLPDDDREWSLAGRPKAAKKPAMTLTTCKGCLAVWSRDMRGRACPRCGAEPAAVVRRPPQERDGLLVRITRKQQLAARRARSQAMAERPPPSWAPPQLWNRLEAKRRREGYLPGWTVGACRARMRG